MRALVTGCAGFIGSHLAESLLADGHTVVGADCLLGNYPAADKLANLEGLTAAAAFELVRADLSSDPLAALVDGCDPVFHLAGEPGVRTSWGRPFGSYVRNNVVATQRLLEAVRTVPGTRFVYASSSSVYGDAPRLPTPEETAPAPASPYAVTKLAGEQLVETYRDAFGIDAVVLRYFSAYGPRQRPDMAFHRFCCAALAGDPVVVFGDGRQTRDFTYVDDIVRATRAAATTQGAGGATLNVGGGARVSVNDTLRVLRDLLGEPLDVRRVARERGDVHHTGADIRRAGAILRFRPATPFAEGLRREMEWVRTRTQVRAHGG
ncbi:MAG: NAD-dependent epimerase/dehydratase family protein [Actinomycetota bacterium]